MWLRLSLANWFRFSFSGIPNFLLIQEDAHLAAAYQNKSVAEQNSVDLAWQALMSSEFEALRACIFSDIAELRRFRQLLVNSVIATDIFDKELATARKARWDKAFSEEFQEGSRVAINRKATIVIEHLIQASDVAHTMQHETPPGILPKTLCPNVPYEL